MAIPVHSPIDFNGLESWNFRLHNLTSNPSIGGGGVYFNSAVTRPRWTPDGVVWHDIYPSSIATAPNTTVVRDGSGNINANSFLGNATTATAWLNPAQLQITGKAVAAAVNVNTGLGTISLNVTGLSVAAGDIALANNHMLVGSVGGSAVAVNLGTITLDRWGPPLFNISMNFKRINNLATPVADSDAVNKAYVDSIASGLSPKDPARCATVTPLPSFTFNGTDTLTATANGALSNTVTDGITVLAGNRIVVRGEMESPEDLGAEMSAGGTFANGNYFFAVQPVNGSSIGRVEQINVLVTSGPSQKITLRWRTDTKATSYRVYRGTAIGTYAASSLLGTVSPTTGTTEFEVLGSETLAAGQPNLTFLGGALNGLYDVIQPGAGGAPWILQRTADCNESTEIRPGAFVQVTEGSLFGKVGLVIRASQDGGASPTINVHDVIWVLFSQASNYTGTAPIVVSGTTISLAIDGTLSAAGGNLGISPSYPGQTSITTVGSIGTGTWNATAIAPSRGGTGVTSYAVGDLLIGATGSALTKLAAVATGNVLLSGGVAANPFWGKIGLTTHISGTLGIGNGGTGLTAVTANGVLKGNSGGTGIDQVNAPTPGQVMIGNASSIPTFATLGGAIASVSGTGVVSLANASVAYATFQQIPGLSVLGVQGAATAVIAPITATTDNTVLRRSGSSVGFGSLNLNAAGLFSGILPSANGGTGVAFFGVAGPTALRTYTFSNRNANIPAMAVFPVGNGSSTTITLNHNLNTRDVKVEVFKTASPYDMILVDNRRDTVDSVTLHFGNAPASNEFRAVITAMPA